MNRFQLRSALSATPASRFRANVVAAAVTGLALPLVAGCGGSSDDNGSLAPAIGTLTAPPVGSTDDFLVTDTTSGNNTVVWRLEYKVSTSSADGSYSQTVTGNENVTVGQTYYGPLNQVDSYDTHHALVSYSVVQTPAFVCTYDPPQLPLPTHQAVGTSLPASTAHIACSNGRSLVEQIGAGSVVATESISVPAGTFTARKASYQEVISYSDSSVVRTEDISIWSDAASGRQLQVTIDYRYSGAVPSGYLTRRVRQLQSTS